MENLASLNIGTSTQKWITNDLTGRNQSALVNNVKSTNTEVTSRVPQGFVLCPVLPLLFINDITQGTSSSVTLYADDYVMYREVECDHDRSALQEDLGKIQTRCLK